jgi:squalene-hopene/tetraprenyl-beta-curcumene cyclase
MLKTRFRRKLAQLASRGSVAAPRESRGPIDVAELEESIAMARAGLESEQQADGHFIYELEADCTIPAEYIMLNHFMGEVDDVLERKIANHLRTRQAEHGGWPLFHGGDFDLSCTIKAYYALKLVGDHIESLKRPGVEKKVAPHGRQTEPCGITGYSGKFKFLQQ